MNRCLWLALIAFCAFFAAEPSLEAADRVAPKIVKVLPHFLDKEGRKSLSPSLYERDAYQAVLRKDRALCSALRYDIQWRATGLGKSKEALKLRLELRTTKGSTSDTTTFEQEVQPRGWGSRWTAVMVEGKAFEDLGEVTAWRASLIRNGESVAHQQSFLW